MSELKWSWVYYPYLDPPEKQKESALKAGYNKVYLKSEADKVISELKQRLALVNLTLRLNQPEALYSNLETMGRLSHEIDVVARRERHQKYKRCLAMAEMCRARYDEEYATVNGRGASWEYISKEMKYLKKWQRRWLAIAEKFKEDIK